MAWLILSFCLLLGGMAMLFYSKHIDNHNLECFSFIFIVITVFVLTKSLKMLERDYLLNAVFKGQVKYSTTINSDNDTIYKFEGYK